jgi:hypothetical protein
MADAVKEIAVEEWNAMRERARQNPSTLDDVWVTADGERLDTPAKLIAFLRDYNAQIERESLSRGATRRAAR